MRWVWSSTLLLLGLFVLPAVVPQIFVQWNSPQDDALPWASFQRSLDRDIFTRALRGASSNSDQTTRVTAHLPSLKAIYEHSPALLEQYLEASPAWRINVRADGTRHAGRRIQIGGDWKYTSSIRRSDLGLELQPEEAWTLDVRINWHGDTATYMPPHRLAFGQAIELQEDELVGVPSEKTQPAYVMDLGRYYSSEILIQEGDLTVKIWEWSRTASRRMTRAAIRALEKEFATLSAQIESGAYNQYIRKFGIVSKPNIVLRSNPPSQGLYDTQLLINPGEPGTVFLKAFSVPEGAPIFEEELERIRERVGWSDDPEVNYYANSFLPTRATDKAYDVRLEAWFKPDDDQKARKLIERTFSILPTVL